MWVECDTRHGQMDSAPSRAIMGLGMIHVHVKQAFPLELVRESSCVNTCLAGKVLD